MKKYSWIVALLLALSLAFLGCPNDGGKDDGKEKEKEGETEDVILFDMQDASKGTIKHGIQELTVGDLTFNDSDKENGNPLKPIVKAGNMPDHITSFKAVDNGGKIALEYVTKVDWGPGFDLPNSVFGFLAGDKITVTGKAEGATIDLAFNKNQGGSQNITGNRVTEAGDFTVEATLTASDITAIKANEQKVLRFEDRAASNTTVTIYNIVIEGKRPTTVTKLAAPVVTVTATGVEWTAIEGASGYKVFAGDEEDPIATLADETSINLILLDALDPGTYSITVVALGTAGSTSDSDKSAPVTFVKPVPEVEQLVFGTGAGKIAVTAPKSGSVTVLSDGSGFTFAHPADADNDVNYGDAYATFAVDFGTGGKLSDFTAIKATFVGVQGDIGWKHVLLFASETAFTGKRVDNVSDGKIGDYNAAANNETPTVMTYDISEVTGIDSQTVYFVIMMWAGGNATTPTTYTISNVEFVK